MGNGSGNDLGEINIAEFLIFVLFRTHGKGTSPFVNGVGIFARDTVILLGWLSKTTLPTGFSRRKTTTTTNFPDL